MNSFIIKSHKCFFIFISDLHLYHNRIKVGMSLQKKNKSWNELLNYWCVLTNNMPTRHFTSQESLKFKILLISFKIGLRNKTHPLYVSFFFCYLINKYLIALTMTLSTPKSENLKHPQDSSQQLITKINFFFSFWLEINKYETRIAIILEHN